MLYLNIKECLKLNNISKGDIASFITSKQEIVCGKCQKLIKTKFSFLNLPKILIILFQNQEKLESFLNKETFTIFIGN